VLALRYDSEVYVEKTMKMLKKATVALATASLVAAPVAASAAPQTLRADTTVAGEAMGEGAGGSVWILGLVGLGLFIFGAIELFDGGDDSPTSP
jgi:hypothetical protein